MKKIIHIQVIPQMSGVQKISFDILKSIKGDYDKYIMFGGEYVAVNGFFERFENHGVKVILNKHLRRDIGWHDVKCFIELYKFFKVNKFDIVHTNSTKPGIIARIAAKLAGTKCVIHTIHGIAYHQFENPVKRIFYYFLDYISSLFSDVLICVNKYYLRFYTLIKNKVTIYNSIEWNSDAIYSERSNKNTIVVGFLSRLDEQKDPMTLIKALEYIKNNYNEKKFRVKLLIGGNGELYDFCNEYVNVNCLSHDIEFVGWVDRKSDFFEKIDVFCLPSIFEAFGLVLLEASNHFKPIIATNVEGIPELIQDGVNGLHIKPRDYVDLANKIIFFAENQNVLNEYGLKGFSLAKEKFSFEKMILEYQEIYDKV